MVAIVLWAVANSAVAQTGLVADPLPSWNDGAARRAVLDFIAGATREGGPDFIPPAERVATFDNDGTLWSEQPVYVQFAFAVDRVKTLALRHPEWKDREPFSWVLNGDLASLAASGEQGLLEIVAATHAGTTVDEFRTSVQEWMAAARHPRFNQPYNQLIYQPMRELLDFLRSKGFKTYIVSGGGIDFMRPWAEQTYGVPPEQVIGSSLRLKYELRDGEPVLVKVAEVNQINDKDGKPVSIEQFIGRRPVAAFGNSDGDYEMLCYATSKGADTSYRRFGLIVHHTDVEREWAYDRESHVGRLSKALDEAQDRGWTVVDMKRDWKTVYPLGETSR
ncbi:MAG: HAD family hydrolase [Pirellulaceae bacterium]